MLSKYNPIAILRDHLSSFYTFEERGCNNEYYGTDRHEKISWYEISGFIAMPILLAVAVFYYCHWLSAEVTGHLLTAFSIFCALLLTLQMMTYQSLERAQEQQHENVRTKLRKKYLTEIIANVSYAILVSVIEITILIVYSHQYLVKSDDGILSILSIVIVYFAGSFVLTLLMVLVRVHLLMTRSAS